MIGKVYANAEREEDRADQTLIEMGAIAGEGLLGKVIAVVDKLVETGVDQGYYDANSVEGIEAADKAESAWLELFAALKAIETQSEEVMAAIEEARYAMVEGNLAGDPIPVDVVARWLANIEDAPGAPIDGGPVPADILQCQGCGKSASSLSTWTIKDEGGERIIWLCENCQSTRMLTEAQGWIEELPETEL